MSHLSDWPIDPVAEDARKIEALAFGSQKDLVDADEGDAFLERYRLSQRKAPANSTVGAPWPDLGRGRTGVGALVMGAIRDVLNLAEPKELGGSNEKKGERRSTHVDGSGLKELVVDVTAIPFKHVSPTDDGALQVSSLAAAVRGGRMFHTAITSAILHLSHRKKMAFHIRVRTNFGMSDHQVWVWSRSSEGAPNTQLDASTYLPLVGTWAPTNDLGPIRTATRELGVRTLFELDQQLRTSKGRDQTSLDQHTATLTGFIGGKPASLTIEALET